MGMLITLEQVEEARRNIAGVALRTPLVRCNTDASAEVYLKLENLQPIGSFKIRGSGERDGTDSAGAVGAGCADCFGGQHGSGSGVLCAADGDSSNDCGSRDGSGYEG